MRQLAGSVLAQILDTPVKHPPARCAGARRDAAAAARGDHAAAQHRAVLQPGLLALPRGELAAAHRGHGRRDGRALHRAAGQARAGARPRLRGAPAARPCRPCCLCCLVHIRRGPALAQGAARPVTGSGSLATAAGRAQGPRRRAHGGPDGRRARAQPAVPVRRRSPPHRLLPAALSVERRRPRGRGVSTCRVAGGCACAGRGCGGGALAAGMRAHVLPVSACSVWCGRTAAAPHIRLVACPLPRAALPRVKRPGIFGNRENRRARAQVPGARGARAGPGGHRPLQPDRAAGARPGGPARLPGGAPGARPRPCGPLPGARHAERAPARLQPLNPNLYLTLCWPCDQSKLEPAAWASRLPGAGKEVLGVCTTSGNRRARLLRRAARAQGALAPLCRQALLELGLSNRVWLGPDTRRSAQVRVVASLPCYTAGNVDAQRGSGVFGRSIAGLRALNAAGYGAPGGDLALDLVYNPSGPFLAPDQAQLEVRGRCAGRALREGGSKPYALHPRAAPSQSCSQSAAGARTGARGGRPARRTGPGAGPDRAGAGRRRSGRGSRRALPVSARGAAGAGGVPRGAARGVRHRVQRPAVPEQHADQALCGLPAAPRPAA